MRKLIYFLIGLVAIISCEKDIPEFGFRIKSSGFSLKNGDLHSADSFPLFSHRLSGGIVSFTGENAIYEFRTGKISIEEYLFKLPAGSYQVEFRIADASLYGQKGGSFQAEPATITVTDQVDTVSVEVVAKCALFLVQDERSQLDNGIYMIRRYASGEGYFSSYPLTLDTISGLYFTYFTPDPDSSNPSAYLWFYEGRPGMATGGLSTLGFESGYQYVIKVLD